MHDRPTPIGRACGALASDTSRPAGPVEPRAPPPASSSTPAPAPADAAGLCTGAAGPPAASIMYGVLSMVYGSMRRPHQARCGGGGPGVTHVPAWEEASTLLLSAVKIDFPASS